MVKKTLLKWDHMELVYQDLLVPLLKQNMMRKEEIMKWPFSVAPYELAIIPMINKNDKSALDKATRNFKHFESNNIDTIIDDMDENLSSKIKKFNLIGVPVSNHYRKKIRR